MENENLYQATADEMIRAMQYLARHKQGRSSSSGFTEIYDGILVSDNGDGKWNVRVNGKTQLLKPYGSVTLTPNTMVKVVIPQGNYSNAFFF